MSAKKLLVIFLVVLFLVGTDVLFFLYFKKSQRLEVKHNTDFQNLNNQTEIKEDNTSLKKSTFLAIPFTPQAPTANWDELHNEACEEASAIMANAYFSNLDTEKLDAKYVEDEISKLTKWQQNNFGYYLDTTSAETARMIEEVYNLKTELIENFSEDDIKQALSANKIVIISENGRLLSNPNYKQPGPIHHMLVVKGYDESNFITNDSGTRNGLNYKYSFKTLYDSAADWDHSTKTVDETKKIAIIVWK